MASVRRAVGLEDEVGLQVPRVVVSRVEVGDDPRRDAEAAEDCGDMKRFTSDTLHAQFNITATRCPPPPAKEKPGPRPRLIAPVPVRLL